MIPILNIKALLLTWYFHGLLTQQLQRHPFSPPYYNNQFLSLVAARAPNASDHRRYEMEKKAPW